MQAFTTSTHPKLVCHPSNSNHANASAQIQEYIIISNIVLPLPIPKAYIAARRAIPAANALPRPAPVCAAPFGVAELEPELVVGVPAVGVVLLPVLVGDPVEETPVEEAPVEEAPVEEALVEEVEIGEEDDDDVTTDTMGTPGVGAKESVAAGGRICVYDESEIVMVPAEEAGDEKTTFVTAEEVSGVGAKESVAAGGSFAPVCANARLEQAKRAKAVIVYCILMVWNLTITSDSR